MYVGVILGAMGTDFYPRLIAAATDKSTCNRLVNEAALIQGMRRISDLVKLGVLGAASGAIISIPIVYALREDGIVPSLICGAAVSLIVSWWYSRKITSIRSRPDQATPPSLWYNYSNREIDQRREADQRR